MKIDCVSDLHGYFPKLEGGDLLIVAGDLTANNYIGQYNSLNCWLKNQDYVKKIVIGGNHDKALQEKRFHFFFITYLQDSSCEFEGLKIWGSPWVKFFNGMNPNCNAFTCDTEEELDEKWSMIPDDIDILITHSPPYSILDENRIGYHCGSESLKKHVLERIKPKLHVFGHIHERGGLTITGKRYDKTDTKFVNASYVNEFYKPLNEVITVEL